jgi:hypothetical protein
MSCARPPQSGARSRGLDLRRRRRAETGAHILALRQNYSRGEEFEPSSRLRGQRFSSPPRRGLDLAWLSQIIALARRCGTVNGTVGPRPCGAPAVGDRRAAGELEARASRMLLVVPPATAPDDRHRFRYCLNPATGMSGPPLVRRPTLTSGGALFASRSWRTIRFLLTPPSVPGRLRSGGNRLGFGRRERGSQLSA